MRAEAHRTRGRLHFGAHVRLEPLPVRVNQADHPYRRLGDARGEPGDRVQRRFGLGVEHLQLLQPAAAAQFVERQRRHPARELGEQQPGVLGLVEEGIGPRLPAQRLPGMADRLLSTTTRGARPGVARTRRSTSSPLPCASERSSSTVSGRCASISAQASSSPAACRPRTARDDRRAADQVVPQERGVLDDDDAHDGGSTGDRTSSMFRSGAPPHSGTSPMQGSAARRS